jgi:hypothetical protein
MPPHFPNWLGSPRARWGIVGLHLLFLLGIYLYQGIHTDKEALKYLGCAQDILQGDLTDILGNYLKYGAYVLFLLPFVALGVPELAVFAQIILGILGAVALSRIVVRITGNAVAGNLAMALLLLCYPVQQWTLALYTESFFTSMAILFVERITRAQRPDVWTIALAVITVFARPVGMLFVGPALVWKTTGSDAPKWLKGLRWPGYAAVLLVAISLPGIRAPQLEPIVDAHIIAGIAEDPGALAEFEGSSILAAQAFLMKRHGVRDWLWLGARRIASLYTLPRGYFSTVHNMLVAAWMLLYPLAIWGSRSWHELPQVRLVLVILLLHTLLVGLTHDEWSGRFVVPLLPWVILLALLLLGKSQQESRV